MLRSLAKNLTDRLRRLFYGDQLFNRDMSLEIDRLQIEIDRRDDKLSVIRDRLHELLRLLDS